VKTRKMLIAAFGCCQQMVLVTSALLGFGTTGWPSCITYTDIPGGVHNGCTCKGIVCQYVVTGGCALPQVTRNYQCQSNTYQTWINSCTNGCDSSCTTQPAYVNVTTGFLDATKPC
jgi:hypothetical protein